MKTQRLFESIENQAPPELEEGHEIPLHDRLADAGLTECQIQAVEAQVEAEVERLSFHRAGEVLRRVFCHISSYGTACAGLAYALGLAGGRSVSDLATELGFSKQACGNMTARLVPLLGPLAVSKAGTHEPVRPTEPGTWLTLQEANKTSGRTSAAIQDAGRKGELRRVKSGARYFYDSESVTAWHGRLTLRTATETQWKHPTQQNSNPEQSARCSA